MRVHLAVFVVVLVASFIDHGYCQLDCAFPVVNDFMIGIADSILGGDSPETPTISISESHVLCLAHSEQRDRYRFYSVLVNYTCVGNANCPDGYVVEQFEGQCVSGDWSGNVLGTFLNTQSEPNEGATFTTNRSDNCSFCISEEKRDEFNIDRFLDPVTHCLDCVDCGDDRTCSDFSSSCCDVFSNEMCMGACPVGQRPDENLDCENITCPDDLGDAPNGRVDYSNPVETDGEYRIGTVATVTCDTDYIGGGDVNCQDDGTWSSSLPTCTEIPFCDQPPDVDNAEVTNEMDRWDIGSTATYMCLDDFYFADGSEVSITCSDSAEWPETANIKCVLCGDRFPDCKVCSGTPEDAMCTDCEQNFRMRDDNKCEEITGGGDDNGGNETCIPCIVVPLAVLLALLLAIVVAVAMYAYYRWHKAPPTDLNKKDPEGINGVARDNPLYVDPEAVAGEGEE